MACSSPEPRRRAGFATAAAMTWSAALALTAAVALSAATADLRSARRGYDQARMEARLETAQVMAAAAVMGDPGSDRLAWTLAVDGAGVTVLAEPEAAKLGWAAASGDPEALEALSPSAPAQARAALARLAATPEASAGDVTALDPSSRWQACAASMLSPHGVGDGAIMATRAPKPGRGGWRIGQVWRIRAVHPAGWTETRHLRFTGEPGRPWAVLDRTLSATPRGVLPCLPRDPAGAR